MKKMVTNSLLLIILVLFFHGLSFGQTPTRWMNIKSGETVVYNVKVTDSLVIQFAVIDSGYVDMDGNSYSTVRIGTQEWTVENLRTTKYNDGTSINKITDNTQWRTTTSGAYSAYNNDENNVSMNGYLYNWYAVSTGSLATVTGGWRVPTDEDFNQLVTYCGGSGTAGKLLKSTFSWINGGNGTDQYGFTAVPSGTRWGLFDGSFNNLLERFYTWSSSQEDATTAWARLIFTEQDVVFRGNFTKADGMAVRLVRNIE